MDFMICSQYWEEMNLFGVWEKLKKVCHWNHVLGRCFFFFFLFSSVLLSLSVTWPPSSKEHPLQAQTLTVMMFCNTADPKPIMNWCLWNHESKMVVLQLESFLKVFVRELKCWATIPSTQNWLYLKKYKSIVKL